MKLNDLGVVIVYFFNNFKMYRSSLIIKSYIYRFRSQGLVTVHVNILSMHKHKQGRTLFYLCLLQVVFVF